MRADHHVGLEAFIDVKQLLAELIGQFLVHLDRKIAILLRLFHRFKGFAVNLWDMGHAHAIPFIHHFAENRLNIVKGVQQLAFMAAIRHSLHDAFGGLIMSLACRHGQKQNAHVPDCTSSIDFYSAINNLRISPARYSDPQISTTPCSPALFCAADSACSVSSHSKTGFSVRSR